MTYDAGGDGRTVLRANFGRFHAGLGPAPANFINPLGGYTGLLVAYADLNADGQISRDDHYQF